MRRVTGWWRNLIKRGVIIRVVARCPYCGRASARPRPAGPDLVMAPTRVGGMTAGERERDRPGTGEFSLASAGGRPLVGIFDGLGLYSPDPDALVGEVR